MRTDIIVVKVHEQMEEIRCKSKPSRFVLRSFTERHDCVVMSDTYVCPDFF